MELWGGGKQKFLANAVIFLTTLTFWSIDQHTSSFSACYLRRKFQDKMQTEAEDTTFYLGMGNTYLNIGCC